MRRPIRYQELPKRFLFVFSPTMHTCCQEWTSLLRLDPDLDKAAGGLRSFYIEAL
jgi:hypothetical protein